MNIGHTWVILWRAAKVLLYERLVNILGLEL